MDCPLPRRERFLDRVCRGNIELRRQVCELLAHSPPDDDWLESPVPGAAGELLEVAQWVGQRGTIGPYRIDGLVAVGGMGVVLRGVDESSPAPVPVAIKLLRRSIWTGRTLRAFRREQRLLRQLNHPNISRFIDAGLSPEGQPYLVMEFVSGLPLDEYARASGPSLSNLLRLFRTICLAVHHAHQHLIVHRDLKPANILVAEGGTAGREVPGGVEPQSSPVPVAPQTPAPQVKIIDFGIAKLLQERAASEDTKTETLRDAMTLQFSSPEQIRGEPITTATDIYSLGVILYELLAGRPPYDLAGRSRYEAEKLICEASVPAPGAARGSLISSGRKPWGAALDRIVLMAMHKEPSRRYASAEQLAEDIRRYLDGSAVLAYRPRPLERAAATIRKHRVAFGVAAISFLLVSTLAVVSAFMARAATRARDREARAREVAQRISGFMGELLARAYPPERGPPDVGLRMLDDASALVQRELADQPAIAADIYAQIGDAYSHMRRQTQAVANYRRAVDEHRRSGQPDEAKLADCLSALGSLLSYGDDEAGLACEQEALDIRRRLYGDEDLRVADSLHGVAFALTRSARPPRYQEAESLYQKALGLRQRLGAAQSPAIARNLHALAALARHQGRPEEAAVLYARALELSRQVLTSADPRLIDCLNDYAFCLMDLRRHAEAEVLLRESLDLTSRTLGDVAAASVHGHLAHAAQYRADRPAAWRAMHRALARLCRALATQRGGESARHWLGLEDFFERAPAELQQSAIAEFVSSAPASYAPGDLPPSLWARLMDNLAGLVAEDQPDAFAEGLSRESLRLLDAHHPKDDLTRAAYEQTLAGILLSQGRRAEAEQLLEHAVEALRVGRGPDHHETRTAIARLDLARNQS